jgi:hypothetical protein
VKMAADNLPDGKGEVIGPHRVVRFEC